ncbi:DNA/RNA non-specific endonuclease [Corynebacterium sp. 20_84]
MIEDISHEIKGGRHQGIQGSVGREADLTIDGKKVLDFDGGHINAAMSGGIREEINYTPQNVDVNQSRKGMENYYALEQKWKELSPNNKVDVVIRNIYEEDVQKSTGVNSNVPTKYIVQYDVNGKDPVEVVMNNVGQ